MLSYDFPSVGQQSYWQMEYKSRELPNVYSLAANSCVQLDYMPLQEQLIDCCKGTAFPNACLSTRQ